MKVQLINPPRFNKTPVIREVRCAGLSPVSVFPPLNLAYIASFLRERGIDISLIDANALDLSWNDVEDSIRKFKPDVIIFKSSPPTMIWDCNTAKIAKKINKKIITILDDSHIAPVFPEKTLKKFPYIDLLIRGESEKTSFQLIKTIKGKRNFNKVTGISFRKGNKIVNTKPTPPIKNLDDLPIPAFDLLPINKYFSITFSKRKPFMTIITSRGCPFRCDFCIVGGSTVWRGSGNGWFQRSAKSILDEIEHLVKNYKIKDIYFFDETFTVDKKRVLEICKGIKKRNIKINWSCNSRVDSVQDEKMLKTMAEAGCWNLLFGVESGSQEILDSCNKRINISQIKKTFEITKKYGIYASSSFMVGLPGETKETIRKTLKLALELNPDFSQFVITTPYPGTILYEKVKKEGLLERDYKFSSYDAYCVQDHPVLRTEFMSSEEIARAQKWLYKKFYFRLSYILHRLFSIKNFNELKYHLKAMKYVAGV
ncbi:MAG: B12-binding domain-containing radical SAM protein [Candidatus Aenigmatarchaeota archaeon]